MRKITDQRGIAHIVEIVIIAVVVLGVAGFIGWRVWDGMQKKAINIVANAQCMTDLKDEDLCKFFTSWKADTSYKVVTKQTIDGTNTETSMEIADSGKNYHMTTTLQGKPYEVISIGNTFYTKDTSDNKWWKQNLPTNQQQAAEQFKKEDFDTSADTNKPADQRVQYKKLGTEACGDKTCFKYQIIDPANSDGETFIWFDNSEYKMRRMYATGDGVVTDQTFSYGSVSISAPSPTKDLGPNQYVVPGQNQPLTLPSTDDMPIGQ